MNFNDIVGSIGVGLILTAYLANTFNLIPKHGLLYFILNTIGAALACYASLLIDYLPFIILEGVWALVSLFGLIRFLRCVKQV